MRRFLIGILLAFIANSAFSESFVSGKWQAFEKSRLGYRSAILEVDENGQGFFVYTFSEKFDPELVLKISVNEGEFNKRYGFLELDEVNGVKHRLLISHANFSEPQIMVMVYVEGLDKTLEFSEVWVLNKTFTRFIDKELYEFAKKNL